MFPRSLFFFVASFLLAPMTFCMETKENKETKEKVEIQKSKLSVDEPEADTDCPCCSSSAQDVDADHRHITNCCSKFICEPCAHKLEKDASEFYHNLQNDEWRAQYAAQPDFASWPQDAQEHAKCPFCRKYPLQTRRVIMVPSSMRIISRDPVKGNVPSLVDIACNSFVQMLASQSKELTIQNLDSYCEQIALKMRQLPEEFQKMINLKWMDYFRKNYQCHKFVNPNNLRDFDSLDYPLRNYPPHALYILGGQKLAIQSESYLPIWHRKKRFEWEQDSGRVGLNCIGDYNTHSKELIGTNNNTIDIIRSRNNNWNSQSNNNSHQKILCGRLILFTFLPRQQLFKCSPSGTEFVATPGYSYGSGLYFYQKNNEGIWKYKYKLGTEPACINSIAYHPNNDELAFSDTLSPRLHICKRHRLLGWQEQESWNIIGPASDFLRLSYNPKGNELLAQAEKSVTILKKNQNNEYYVAQEITLPDYFDRFYCATYSPDGNEIATVEYIAGNETRVLKFFKNENDLWKVYKSLEWPGNWDRASHYNNPPNLLYSPDGNELFAIDPDNNCYFYDLLVQEISSEEHAQLSKNILFDSLAIIALNNSQTKNLSQFLESQIFNTQISDNLKRRILEYIKVHLPSMASRNYQEIEKLDEEGNRSEHSSVSISQVQRSKPKKKTISKFLYDNRYALGLVGLGILASSVYAKNKK